MAVKLSPGATVGIIGGGQLGRMLCLAAAPLGLRTHVLDPDAEAPAFAVATSRTLAAYDDAAALAKLARASDVITYEFENLPAEPLASLGPAVRPNLQALRVAQDRLTEKAFFARCGLPVARHFAVGTAAELAAALEVIGGPAILKTRRFGYDGKGQIGISPGDDLAAALASLGTASGGSSAPGRAAARPQPFAATPLPTSTSSMVRAGADEASPETARPAPVAPSGAVSRATPSDARPQHAASAPNDRPDTARAGTPTAKLAGTRHPEPSSRPGPTGEQAEGHAFRGSTAKATRGGPDGPGPQSSIRAPLGGQSQERSDIAAPAVMAAGSRRAGTDGTARADTAPLGRPSSGMTPGRTEFAASPYGEAATDLTPAAVSSPAAGESVPSVRSLDEAPFILEERVAFLAETSTVLVRGEDGTCLAYDAPENVHEAGILRRSSVPGPLTGALERLAAELTAKLAHALDYVGVLAIEWFVTGDPQCPLIANEMAPRVHNTGHWTMDGALTGQFENHLRAVAGLPLGAVARHSDVTMENLLGDAVEGWRDHLQEPAAKLHLYGKRSVRPGRKMGHVNMVRLLQRPLSG